MKGWGIGLAFLVIAACAPQAPAPPKEGVKLVLQVEPAEQLDASISVVRERLVSAGRDEVSTIMRKPDRIEVLLPGREDPAPIVDLVTRPGVLGFHLVDRDASASDYQPGIASNDRILLPDDSGLTAATVVFDDPFVANHNVAAAEAGLDMSGRPNILFELREPGREKLEYATTNNVGGQFAVVLDGRILSAPNIMSPIAGGSGQITGAFTAEEAKTLAAILRTGLLPAKLTLVETTTFGETP